MLNTKDSKKGINQADMYQMLAYANQYKCNNVVLIYPYSKEAGDVSSVFHTKEGDINISIWNIDLSDLLSTDSRMIENQLRSKLTNVLGLAAI